MTSRTLKYIFLLFTNLIGYSLQAQTIQKIIFDSTDIERGYYLAVEPKNKETIQGTLVLLAGFGQSPEHTPPETKLHNVAFNNEVLTIFSAGGNKLYIDSTTQEMVTKMMLDILKRYKVSPKSFVLGGFSAGGMLAMRYVELCSQYPLKFPIQPKGIFTVDAPIDIFTIYEQLEQSVQNNYSELAVEEAVRAIAHIKKDYGVPREHIGIYASMNPFNMNKEYGQNEKWLKNIAVRTYHDVDIAWRIKNRHQTVHLSNYEMSAELINRLNLMGNKQAEFMQSFQTGYRSNGQRHPHSWSIVNEVELIQWVKGL